jgi:NTE family protein
MGERSKIGLALGGGGARGLAHVGVLKVLEREGIPFDLIVGTSMGAIIGAAYAIEPNAALLERRVLNFFQPERGQNRKLKLLEKLDWPHPEKSDLFRQFMEFIGKEIALNLILVRKALFSEKDLRRLLRAILPEIDLRDTKIPFFAAAVDLISGRKIILDRGSIINAVMASCAVPGFMPPIPLDGMILVDGGVIEALPCLAAREKGAEFVIGVDVGLCICNPPVIGDGLDEIQRVMEIMCFYLNQVHLENADIIIQPKVKDSRWADFSKHKELIQEGERAAEAKMKEIHQILIRGREIGLWRRFKGIFAGHLKKEVNS